MLFRTTHPAVPCLVWEALTVFAASCSLLFYGYGPLSWASIRLWLSSDVNMLVVKKIDNNLFDFIFSSWTNTETTAWKAHHPFYRQKLIEKWQKFNLCASNPLLCGCLVFSSCFPSRGSSPEGAADHHQAAVHAGEQTRTHRCSREAGGGFDAGPQVPEEPDWKPHK